jgi:hypothetical protein
MKYFFICFVCCWFMAQSNLQAQEGFIGEIKAFGFDFIPRGFMACDGQELKISDYNNLFKAIGTRYGGDGKINFKLPNLNNRILLGAHETLPVGTSGGSNNTVKLAKGSRSVHAGIMPTVGITYAICVEGFIAETGGDANTASTQPPINVQNESGKVAIPSPPTPPVTVLATATKTQSTWSGLLNSGQVLEIDKKILHERGYFVLQKDGNLVLYDKNNKPMWASGKKSPLVKTAIMNPFGSLTVLGKDAVIWSTNTTSIGAYLQIDWASYTLRIVDKAGKEIWRSKK